MRGVLDLELYNRTKEIVMIEPLTKFVPPPEPADGYPPSQRAWRKGVDFGMGLNKPKKEVLEGHLRNGMTASEIGVKYDATRATIYNWIRSYGLQGIKGQKGEAVQESPPVTVVQESPTLPEIEQFHTDEPVQGLPKVDLEPSGMTEEENMTDAEWETRLKEGYSNGAVSADPAPRETFDEIWQDARSDLATLERLYVAQAKQSFRDRLREMLTEITGELGLKDV